MLMKSTTGLDFNDDYIKNLDHLKFVFVTERFTELNMLLIVV